MSSAYLRLLLFLPATLTPASAPSSLAFYMMYSAYKLNKHGDLTSSFPNLEPVHFSMSGSNWCFLTCIQVSQEAGKVVWYCHLFKNFPQFFVTHTVKGFHVNEAEVDFFLEYPCFLHEPMNVGNSISVSIWYLVGFVKTDLQTTALQSWKCGHFLWKKNVRLIEYESLQTSKSLPRHRPRLD